MIRVTTYHSVKREIFINAKPEKVWKALTSGEERNKWETKSCKIELKVGGKFSADYGWGVAHSATIVEIVEKKRLIMEDENNGRTIWTVTPQNNGSLVTLEFNGLWTGDLGMMEMENSSFGQYQFMRNMKSVIENNEDIRHLFWNSWIGMQHKTIEREGFKAREIVKIVPNTPADEVLRIGDLITSVNDQTVTTYDDLERVITEMPPQQEIKLAIKRDDKIKDVYLVTVPYGSTKSPTPSK
ncbi:SRPBCC domain-containing protein [Bacillus sp. SCS-151]|uniref:SRPBCC domain-containing protein n=1 Tax=Nanhaiella sioensis TaxID=3115293 RepID=UPI00397A6F99